ncbi:DUF805 domain-containing protein [Mucilaginibacter terrigena]|uniref:DUF805 domain-containing protein n=1 Tax=Mucilaginibacter terrigena TaxID=2492395 RepID=A0A4Q5LGU1_9SPHI|nr:DUF805 domain-containing protein [Mucilaginibacter terrigena]RYU86147.1 DUF805 domain-containing protein [Mucilaginibacter terrigena]
MKYYFMVLQKYAQFSGRARRSEYWYFALFSTIISLALKYVGIAAGSPFLDSIYSLGVIIPSIAVGVRRMHDVGKSGWFILIPLYNLILACTDGTPGDNEYGPDPKGREGFGEWDYQKPTDVETNA